MKQKHPGACCSLLFICSEPSLRLRDLSPHHSFSLRIALHPSVLYLRDLEKKTTKEFETDKHVILGTRLVQTQKIWVLKGHPLQVSAHLLVGDDWGDEDGAMTMMTVTCWWCLTEFCRMEVTTQSSWALLLVFRHRSILHWPVLGSTSGIYQQNKQENKRGFVCWWREGEK